jgi:hypothetical protein
MNNIIRTLFCAHSAVPGQGKSKSKPNIAKSSQARAKKIKGKGLDFLGLPCPNRAFSRGCADPLGHFSLLRSFAALMAA